MWLVSRFILATCPDLDYMYKTKRDHAMQILHLPSQPGAEPVPQAIDPAARRRVSGPGLRSFLAIAERYGLSTQDRIALLGEPSRSTYHEWVRKAHANAALSLPLDTLTRISGVLGIHKALSILFVIEAEGMTWLKGPHRGDVFGGQAPIELMVEGGLDGILTVRRYLDAWRGGLRGGPGEGVAFDAIGEQDIVFS